MVAGGSLDVPSGQETAVRLPTVDEFRQPFIEPLGYLTLLAAQVDLIMTDSIALVLAGNDPCCTRDTF